MVTSPDADSWTVDYRPGGWARLRRGGVTVYLRLDSEGVPRARLQMRMAVVSTDEPLTEAAWRSVPVAAVGMHLAVLSGVTSPEIDHMMAELAKPVDIEGYSPEALERYFADTEPLSLQGQIPGGVAVGGKPLSERITLARPAGGRLTDEFLRELAGLYLATVDAGNAPGPIIAETANVPVRTVHRWVSEARRRGFLPAATKGKAG